MKNECISQDREEQRYQVAVRQEQEPFGMILRESAINLVTGKE